MPSGHAVVRLELNGRLEADVRAGSEDQEALNGSTTSIMETVSVRVGCPSQV